MKWMFTTEKARAKMGRAYPKPTALFNQPAIVADPTVRPVVSLRPNPMTTKQRRKSD